MTVVGNDLRARSLELPSEDKQARLRERLARKSERVGDCLEWRGAFNSNGYGVTAGHHFGRDRVYVHRVAWALENGSLPDRKIVRHRCDNKVCIEPGHLTIGSTADNNADTIERWDDPRRFGTWTARGVAHPNAKLDDEKVRDIRRRFATGAVTVAQLAREHGMAERPIRRVVRGEAWTHVK